MFKFLSNKQNSGKPIKKKFNGADHYVFPAVIAKTGVMNNVFYSADVLNNTHDLWNGVKVTLRHPQFNGNNTSINSADISGKFSIGEIYNVKFEDDKLKGDIYINEASIEDKQASYLLDWLNEGKNIDVSTGLDKVSLTNQEGEHDGKKYNAILNSFKADHVAILPDEKGACSAADGCGTLFNSDISYSDIISMLYTAMGDVDAHIEDIFDGYFIINDQDVLYKQDYAMLDDKISLGNKQMVVKRTDYIAANKEDGCECHINNGEGGFLPMKDKLIQFLSNAELTSISEEDKKAFNSMSDAVIDALIGKIIKEDDADKIVINSDEKAEFDAYKADKAEKQTALKNEFKELFNATDEVVNDMTIANIEFLVNQEKNKKPEQKKVDFSGKGSLNNQDQGVEVLTNKQQIDNYAKFLKGEK